MSKYINDFLFVTGLLFIFIPIFRFNMDIGFFVLGVALILLVYILSKRRGDSS